MTYTKEDLERMKRSLGITDEELAAKVTDDVRGQIISVCAYVEYKETATGHRNVVKYAAKIPGETYVLNNSDADTFAESCHRLCKKFKKVTYGRRINNAVGALSVGLLTTNLRNLYPYEWEIFCEALSKDSLIVYKEASIKILDAKKAGPNDITIIYE